MARQQTKVKASSARAKQIDPGYKLEMLPYAGKKLRYAHASCDETIDHLDTLLETGSLTAESFLRNLPDRLNTIGGKLPRFIQSLDARHIPIKEDCVEHRAGTSTSSPRNPNLVIRIP